MNPLILVPIIYVFYGSNVPDYLWLNIELASRYNDVIIISHMKHYQHTSDEYRSQNRRVIFENLDDYTTSANEFAPAYIHLMKADYSEHRVKHERACFQRWFVLKDYMEKNNISRSFFGDGDSSVFVNVTQINALHSHCDAVINVETQDSKFKWTGAGEASLWSLHAIQDFCRFTTDMYKSHIEVIKLKGGRGKTNFVDMSMLYVWWVSHHDAPGWEAGRPWLIEDRNPNAGMLATTRKFCDEEFQVVKKTKFTCVRKWCQATSLQRCFRSKQDSVRSFCSLGVGGRFQFKSERNWYPLWYWSITTCRRCPGESRPERLGNTKQSAVVFQQYTLPRRRQVSRTV